MPRVPGLGDDFAFLRLAACIFHGRPCARQRRRRLSAVLRTLKKTTKVVTWPAANGDGGRSASEVVARRAMRRSRRREQTGEPVTQHFFFARRDERAVAVDAAENHSGAALWADAVVRGVVHGALGRAISGEGIQGNRGPDISGGDHRHSDAVVVVFGTERFEPPVHGVLGAGIFERKGAEKSPMTLVTTAK